MEKTVFVDVLLPLPLNQLFTYRVQESFFDTIQVGTRVVVQFHKQSIYTAIVCNIHHTAPLNYTANYIINVLDDKPLITPLQLVIWDWVANYYCCTMGEVMQFALPSGLNITSTSKIQF